MSEKANLDVEDRLPWHQFAWASLMAYRAQNRIPHALLIAGKRGSGKSHLVRRFGKALLCRHGGTEEEACGQCRSCKLFDGETHPDFIQVAPEEEGKEITVGAIRNLSAALALSPQYGGYRIVVISPAQRMNTSAANSLLKTLEQPIEKTVITLLSDEPYALLPTIASRCQRLEIALPSRQAALDWLKRMGLGDRAAVLLAAAQGAPLAALLMDKSDALSLRNELLNAWLASPPGTPNPVATAEKWTRLPADQVIFWLSSWMIDMVRLKFSGQPPSLYNPDIRERLQSVAQQLNLTQLFRCLDLLAMTKSQINSQVNRQLMFENILIQWTEIRETS